MASRQKPKADKKIGRLKIQDHRSTLAQLDEFLKGLRAFGHQENRSFVMESLRRWGCFAIEHLG
jgi:hypothetical protein